jgi:alkylation response protein AidB-like acyl-CoA dehydrogenase
VDLSPDETASAARDLVRAVLARHPGRELAREAEPLGHDPKLWSELCATGLPGVAVDERRGGGGAGLLALVVAAGELGAVLAPVPWPEHTVAARLLASVAPRHPDLAAVVAGELVATLAPRVHGDRALAVPAGAVADLVLAVHRDGLVAVRSRPPGAAPPNQGSLPVADRHLSDGDRAVLAVGPPAAAAFATAYREWAAVLAGWLAGLAEAALELVTGWVKERVQFGVPIGSFQAVQHGLADLPGLVDGAGLLAREAAWSLDTGRRTVTGADGAQLASMALLFAADTARQVSRRLVQYHGGLGVAVEHDAQMFFRRARAYPLLTGPPRHLLRELGTGLLEAAGPADAAGPLEATGPADAAGPLEAAGPAEGDGTAEGDGS